MNCENCSALRWHPNKGFFCTVPNCNPDTGLEDVKEIYKSIETDSRTNQISDKPIPTQANKEQSTDCNELRKGESD